MELDEWDQGQFDEWELPSFAPFTGESSTIEVVKEPYGQQKNSRLLPEVELGSSSDEDAPPLPETNQLARENHKLRSIMTGLKQQSKNAELANNDLKLQLDAFRSVFKTQMKSNFLSMLH